MRKLSFKLFITIVAFFAFMVFFAPLTAKAAGYCFCADDIETIKPEKSGDPTVFASVSASGCYKQTDESCDQLVYKAEGKRYSSTRCQTYSELPACNSAWKEWSAKRDQRIKGVASFEAETTGLLNIPTCLLKDELSQNCRDVGIFIQLFINWGSGSFAILGLFALCYFIYGGFILILSQGNPEKVKKGTDAMLAAIVGLFICFVAYLVIVFLGEAVGLKTEFTLK